MNTTIKTPTDLRKGEKAYPIYRISVRWSEAEKPDAPHDMPLRFYEGLPEGRFWNGTGWDIMEREERPVEEIVERTRREWWPEYAKTRRDPADLTITVKLLGREVWCSGWFSHWTFNVGLSDIEVLESFNRFVDRIRYSGKPLDEVDGILMGAEDRFRWHGCADGDPQGERTDAPCRCPACKASGLVRIDH